MKIKIGRLRPHSFAVKWIPDVRVLLIGLWFWVIAIDRGFDDSPYKRHYNRFCIVCGDQLSVNSRRQNVLFHKECRTEGRKLLNKLSHESA